MAVDPKTFGRLVEALADAPIDLEAAEAQRETNAMILRQRLGQLAAPIPSTKGMGPKDRAERLHAELERRRALAKDAMKYWRA